MKPRLAPTLAALGVLLCLGAVGSFVGDAMVTYAQSTGGGSGGGGTPGGANTNVQFNNSGSFGGNASFTYDSTGEITLTPAAGDTAGPFNTTGCTATGSQAPLCGVNITGFSLNTTGNPDGWILHASGALTACAGNCFEIDIPGFTLNQLGAGTFAGTVMGAAVSATGNLGFAGGGSGNFNGPTTTVCAGAAPTISSGFGTSPTVPSQNGSCSFELNVGTGGTASSGVVAMNFTAAHHFSCWIQDITTQSASVFLTKQTASTTTTVTFGNFNTSGAATAWAASDILAGGCTVH